MAGIQLSGLASGLDWRSLVDQLISAERAPQTALRTEKSQGQQKSAALEALKTNLSALQTSVKALASGGGSEDIFAARVAKLSASDTGWTTSAATGAETGSHLISVSQLATKSQRLGAADPGRALSATSDVSGLTLATLPIGSPITAGEFTVNGNRVAVALTDSLQDVFDKISTATGGAVSASYDPALDGVRLSGTGEIVLGSANDSSNLLSALGLHNNGTSEVLPPKALGVVSVAAAIANANLNAPISAVDASGAGAFSINGVSIAYNINTDSIDAVLSRINASTAGVTASYDRVNDRFTLSNKTTGDTGLAVNEPAGGLLAALGLGANATLARGKDAQFTIDGGPTLTSASNTFDESTHGITGLSVTATSETAQTVTVSGDTASMRTKIEDFISKFNAVQSFIETQTRTATSADGKVTASLLASNREVTDIAKALRNKAFDAVSGLTGSVQRLESLGIDFKSGTNELTIKDGAKLDSVLASHGEEVRTLFSATPSGLSVRLDAYLTRATGASGSLTTQTENLAKQSRSIDDQISSMERRITQQKTLLEQSFIRMEQSQSRIQSQLSALSNAFGTSSSSK